MKPPRLKRYMGAADFRWRRRDHRKRPPKRPAAAPCRAASTAREANELLFEDTSLGQATAAKRCWRAARRGQGGRVKSLEPCGRHTRVPATRRFFSACKFRTIQKGGPPARSPRIGGFIEYTCRNLADYFSQAGLLATRPDG